MSEFPTVFVSSTENYDGGQIPVVEFIWDGWRFSGYPDGTTYRTPKNAVFAAKNFCKEHGLKYLDE